MLLYFLSISCSKSLVKSSQNLQYKFLDWKWLSPPFFKNSSDLVAGSIPYLPAQPVQGKSAKEAANKGSQGHQGTNPGGVRVGNFEPERVFGWREQGYFLRLRIVLKLFFPPLPAPILLERGNSRRGPEIIGRSKKWNMKGRMDNVHWTCIMIKK